MIELSNDKRCLASLATFSQLHNEKKDIFDVIAGYVKAIICQHNLSYFTLQDMVAKLHDDCGFIIVAAVVRTVLKSKKLSTYIRYDPASEVYNIHADNEVKISISDYACRNREATDNNNRMFELLHDYALENHNGYCEAEKNDLAQAACYFLIDKDVDTRYSATISSFFLRYKDNSHINTICHSIREGMLFLTGLNYNTKEVVEELDCDLTIYLCTEILFHAAGYNGELFRRLFNDFHKQVDDYNARISRHGNKKGRIHLAYFTKIADEVERYFSMAESVVRREIPMNYSHTALRTIIHDCSDADHVLTKKSEFYSHIKGLGIERCAEPDINDYNYNIISKEDLDKVSIDKEEDAYTSLELLNYINYLRRGKECHFFRNTQHILLTEKKQTLRFSVDKCDNTCVPLATSLGFLTCRLWTMLHKGLAGERPDLTSLDIVAKARIVLSTITNRGIGEKYKEILETYKSDSNKSNHDEIVRRLSILQQASKYPEEISDDKIAIESLAVALSDGLEHRLEEEKLKDQTIAELQAYKKAKEQEEYATACDAYDKKLRNATRWDFCKQLAICIMYNLLAIMFVLIAVFSSWFGWVAVILQAALPFLLPLFNIHAIGKAYRYIFYKNKRTEYIAEFKKRYEAQFTRPIPPHDILE